MTPEQFQQLLVVLQKIAERQYTITGAADWPILAAVGGALCAVLAFMWLDLRSSMKEHRYEWQRTIEKHEDENGKAVDLLWQAHRDCQTECCPRTHQPKR